MPAQHLVVALVVLLCASYAAWTIMPSALRRTVAVLILKIRPPEALARPFRQALRPASPCGGCGNCGDTPPKPAAATEHKIILHRRSSR